MPKVMAALIAAAALAMAPALPLAAQHTRVAPEGHVPPPANIADAGWLLGEWVGTGIGGGGGGRKLVAALRGHDGRHIPAGKSPTVRSCSPSSCI